jgi:hypothetical protein
MGYACYLFVPVLRLHKVGKRLGFLKMFRNVVVMVVVVVAIVRKPNVFVIVNATTLRASLNRTVAGDLHNRSLR